MEASPGCKYCNRDKRLMDIMLEICELKVTTLYLFRDQTYRGRCIAAYSKGHKSEIFDLNSQERADLIEDLAKAAAAIKQVFNAAKINYAAFGDTEPHMHFHLVPKYRDGERWGSMFEMMPEKQVFLSDAEYASMISELKKAL